MQGVWYRESTRRKALELGLTGSAVNLPDGTVQVIAYGSESSVAQLKEWLWDGPDTARVTSISCEAVEIEKPEGFITR